jgi:hypothetical protein
VKNNIDWTWYAWVGIPGPGPKRRSALEKCSENTYLRVERTLEVYDKNGKQRKNNKNNFIKKV